MAQTIDTLAATVPYGCSLWYFLQVDGCDTIFCELAEGATAPSGYSLDPSLTIEGAPKIGSVVDPKTMIGSAYDLAFGLRDTAAVRALLSFPSLTTVTSEPYLGSAALAVQDTTGWPASGTLHLGTTAITYTAISSGQFTGLNPGVYQDHYRRYPVGAVVSSSPRYWVGRRVRLYAVVLDPMGYWWASGNVLSDAALLWTGYLTAHPERQATSWTLTARSYERRLTEPFATAAEGKARWDLSDDANVRVSPECVIQFRFYRKYSDVDGDPVSDLLDTVAIQPWAAVTSSSIPGSLARSLVRDAWNASTHSAYIGDMEWSPTILPGTGGFGRRYTLRVNLESFGTGVALSGHAVGIIVEIHGGPCFLLPSNNFRFILPWTDTGLHHDVSIGQATLTVTVTDSDPADLPTSGYVKLSGDDQDATYRYDNLVIDDAEGSVVRLDLSRDTPAPLIALAALEDADELPSPDVTFLWMSDGTFPVAMQTMLQSSGDGDRGTYDTLPAGAGYGLDGVDEASFSAVFDGAFRGLGASVVADIDTSFAELFSGLMQLSRRGITTAPTADGGIGLVAVNLGAPDTAVPVVTITDDDLAWVSGSGVNPIRTVTSSLPPSRVEATPVMADQDRAAPVIVRSSEAAEWGSGALAVKIPGVATSRLIGPVYAWSRGLFAGAETQQRLELDVTPDVSPAIGSVVRLVTTDPAVWDYATGTPGYDGLARVWGSQFNLETGLRTLTVETYGEGVAPLSPSALIDTYDGPDTGPTYVYLDRAYVALMQSYLDAGLGVTNPRLRLYLPGSDDTDTWITYASVTDTGTACRLEVDDTDGSYDLSAGSWRLTLPALAACNTEQTKYLHTSQHVRWT